MITLNDIIFPIDVLRYIEQEKEKAMNGRRVAIQSMNGKPFPESFAGMVFSREEIDKFLEVKAWMLKE